MVMTIKGLSCLPRGSRCKAAVDKPPAAVGLALTFLLLLATGAGAAQINLPAGFVESRVTGFVSPTAMAVAPDGRLFVCEHAGSVVVVKNGVRLSEAFLRVTVHQFGERGLVGIQVDPNFAQNGYVYVYYPAKTPTIHFRLSRFTARGDVAAPGSEVALLDLPKLGPSDWHNGGGIQFSPDGKLFLAVGENNLPALSQSLNTVLGKILRLNRDGSIPTDNPFYARTAGQNRAIWALGLRNPFTLAIQPGTGRLFANDVGAGEWEEINEIVRGGNYGWPVREGAVRDSSATYKDPLYAYAHPPSGPRSSAITGGVFYNPARPNFPAQYVGKYFFVDAGLQIFSVLDTATRTASRFANIPLVNGAPTALPLYLTVAPDGVLHYVARDEKEVRSIRYVGSRTPQIGNPPADLTVSVGDPIAFTVEAYGTAPLRFQWQRKTPPAQNFADLRGATATTLRLPAARLADNNSQFRCLVRNAAGTAASAAAVLTVSGNLPPVPTIITPPVGATFEAGDTISFSGTGTDPEAGQLAPEAFTWRVDFQHLEHAHPFVPDTRGITRGTFAIPRIGETSDQVWYRIYLTATDAGGVARTTYRDVLPVKSKLTLQTDPPGLAVTLDERPFIAPVTEPTVVGLTREIGAADQVVRGIRYRFVSWSDGLPATHTIIVPRAPKTYTARFEAVGTGTAPTVLRFTPAEGARNVPINTTITVTFSEAMNPATLTPATFTVRRADGSANLPATVTYNSATRTATLKPASNLKTDWKHLVTVLGGATGAKNLAGVPVAAASTFFYTKDTQPPVPSAIAVTKITTTGATITWDTPEVANSQVRYGLTAAYTQTSPLQTAQEFHHSITLTGLTRGKTYHFQARSTDPYGNVGFSTDRTFKTAP